MLSIGRARRTISPPRPHSSAARRYLIVSEHVFSTFDGSPVDVLPHPRASGQLGSGVARVNRNVRNRLSVTAHHRVSGPSPSTHSAPSNTNVFRPITLTGKDMVFTTRLYGGKGGHMRPASAHMIRARLEFARGCHRPTPTCRRCRGSRGGVSATTPRTVITATSGGSKLWRREFHRRL